MSQQIAMQTLGSLIYTLKVTMNMLSPSIINGLANGRLSARYVYSVDIQNRMDSATQTLAGYMDSIESDHAHGAVFTDLVSGVFDAPFDSLDDQQREFICCYVNRACYLTHGAIRQRLDPEVITSKIGAILSAARINSELFFRIDDWDL